MADETKETKETKESKAPSDADLIAACGTICDDPELFLKLKRALWEMLPHLLQDTLDMQALCDHLFVSVPELIAHPALQPFLPFLPSAIAKLQRTYSGIVHTFKHFKINLSDTLHAIARALLPWLIKEHSALLVQLIGAAHIHTDPTLFLQEFVAEVISVLSLNGLKRTPNHNNLHVLSYIMPLLRNDKAEILTQIDHLVEEMKQQLNAVLAPPIVVAPVPDVAAASPVPPQEPITTPAG